MTRKSEGTKPLRKEYVEVASLDNLGEVLVDLRGACCVVLPPINSCPQKLSEDIREHLKFISAAIKRDNTLVIVGENYDLSLILPSVSISMYYQTWLAIKRGDKIEPESNSFIPSETFGALIMTGYPGRLIHTKTRLGYEYCINCNKTTKDYGGKKHLYDEFGTLISDVWKDLNVSLNGNLEELFNSLADFFGVQNHEKLLILDFRKFLKRSFLDFGNPFDHPPKEKRLESQLILGDVLDKIRLIPDSSVDLVFADPPYNLNKKYIGNRDDLDFEEYFKWSDLWIDELIRVLRPGRTLAILNVPLSLARYVDHLRTDAVYQNWIVWDALSNPERKIMPAHYGIICFSKGEPRQLPGMTNENPSKLEESVLSISSPNYCSRVKCIRERRIKEINDRKPISDLWTDIHRIKHNTRRVDHPTQLPPKLMYRLISLFTNEGELVLDPFNGSGTTSLCAEQLGRKYVGIEKSETYHELASARHLELSLGVDPFRKEVRILTSKNSRVPRVKKLRYEVPKKTLQLEVREISIRLGHPPSRDEVIKYSRFPIRYFDEYFLNWGEVVAAVRSTGMSEKRPNKALDNFNSDERTEKFVSKN